MSEGTYNVQYQIEQAPIPAYTELSISQRPRAEPLRIKPSASSSIEKLTIDHHPDLVFLISLRGMILFASPDAAKRLLQYDAEELNNRNLCDFLHSADIVSVMRELRTANVGDSVSITCRMKKRLGGCAYFILSGHIYEGEQGKRTKCFVLTAREKPFAPLHTNELLEPSLENVIWLQVSVQGLILYSPPETDQFFGDVLYGKRLSEYIYEHDRPSFATILRLCQTSIDSPYLDFDCTTQHPFPIRVRFHLQNVASAQIIYCELSRNPISALRPIFFEQFDLMLHSDSPHSLHFEYNQMRLANKKLKEEIDSIMANFY
jgi:hypothetical protein